MFTIDEFKRLKQFSPNAAKMLIGEQIFKGPIFEDLRIPRIEKIDDARSINVVRSIDGRHTTIEIEH